MIFLNSIKATKAAKKHVFRKKLSNHCSDASILNLRMEAEYADQYNMRSL